MTTTVIRLYPALEELSFSWCYAFTISLIVMSAKHWFRQFDAANLFMSICLVNFVAVVLHFKRRVNKNMSVLCIEMIGNN